MTAHPPLPSFGKGRPLPWKSSLLAAVVAVVVVAIVLFLESRTAPAKNVILMIADGSGANVIAATGMYEGKLGEQIFDGPAWTKTWASTYPLREGDIPIAGPKGLEQDDEAVYDPSRYWDTTPVTTAKGGYPDHFRGYRWHKDNAPDSADTATALVTGQKTYDGAINVNGNGVKLQTFAEIAHLAGKSVGVVTTVQISDATPAATGGAHNVTREHHGEIAHEMLDAGILSVIIGTGNPDYDNDGARRNAPDYGWISESDWTALKEGKHPGGFTLIQSNANFEKLETISTPPKKLVGIAQSFDSTQFNRAGAMPSTEVPYSVPRRTDVPDLATMAKGALNILGRNPAGMFLMIEGGATDRAEHANNIGRTIEERIEFDQAVAAVSAYLDANTNGNNWHNTLVIVTADHDHLLLGPQSDTVPFQDLVDNGQRHVPGYKWQYGSHSNMLVPLYARGADAAMFKSCAKKSDAYTDAQGRKFGRGAYLDQIQVFAIMSTGNRCIATPVLETQR